MKRWLPLAAFAVLFAFLLAGLWLDPREVPSPFIGKPAPAFTLPVLERRGQTFSPEQARGRPWRSTTLPSTHSARRTTS